MTAPPVSRRAAGAAYCTVANWSANLLVTITFLSLVSAVGKAVTFWIHMPMGLLAIGFVARFVPETKGRPLEATEGYRRHGRRRPAPETSPGTGARPAAPEA